MWILGHIISLKYFLHVEKRSAKTKEINQNHFSTLKCNKLLNYSENTLLLKYHLLLTYISHFYEQKGKQFKEWIQVLDIYVEIMERVSINLL